MAWSKYDAVALGYNELAQLALVLDGGAGARLVSANAAGRLPNRQVVHVADRSYAVVAWNDPPAVERYMNGIWLATEPGYGFDRLRQALAQSDGDADGIFLVGAIRPSTVLAAVKADRRIAAVFSSYAFTGEPGYLGDTYVAFVTGAKYAVTSMRGTIRGRMLSVDTVERQRLGEGSPEDATVRKRLDEFYNSAAFIKAASLSSPGTVLTTRGARGAGSGKFAGSARCLGCHPAEQQQWKRTAHSTAFATMYRTHRNHHPGCVQCHVTGYGQASGFSMAAPLGPLENVGCEACHGPGANHSETPRYDNIIASPLRQVCVSCHTAEHSDFGADR
jgi:hypothetical protein